MAASASLRVSLTKWMKDRGKPIQDMVLNKKPHSTLSKALDKSSFKSIVSCLDCFAHARISRVSKMLSRMNRFFR